MDPDRRRRLARELGDDELAALLVEARHDVVGPVPAPVAERHLGAVVTVAGATAATLAASGIGAAAATGTAAASGGALLFGAKLAAAAGATAVITGGGMAATGTLPDATQTFVADAAASVRIELPRPEEPQVGADDQDVAPSPPGQAPAQADRSPDEPGRAVIPPAEAGAAVRDEGPGADQIPDDRIGGDQRPDAPPTEGTRADRGGEVPEPREDRDASPREDASPSDGSTPPADAPPPRPEPGGGHSDG